MRGGSNKINTTLSGRDRDGGDIKNIIENTERKNYLISISVIHFLLLYNNYYTRQKLWFLLFNGISTFVGHLFVKAIFVERQRWYYLTHH